MIKEIKYRFCDHCITCTLKMLEKERGHTIKAWSFKGIHPFQGQI